MIISRRPSVLHDGHFPDILNYWPAPVFRHNNSLLLNFWASASPRAVLCLPRAQRYVSRGFSYGLTKCMKGMEVSQKYGMMESLFSMSKSFQGRDLILALGGHRGGSPLACRPARVHLDRQKHAWSELFKVDSKKIIKSHHEGSSHLLKRVRKMKTILSYLTKVNTRVIVL